MPDAGLLLYRALTQPIVRRLGHGGRGATTLRVYAAWVAASDRKAAEILGSRMPKRRLGSMD
ncbi:MAG: hypothetical protein ABIZ05_09580 [Pseudonocardiaceae bacterium]